MGTVKELVCSFVVISTFCLSSKIYTETVEEGNPVTLRCADSVSKTNTSVFAWYKERLANQSPDNRVALYDNADGVQNSFGDFQNRARIDITTGALNILHTKVSDDDIYSCVLNNIASGENRNETQLIITVTPSQQDLKLTERPCGFIKVDETVSFKCRASRVKPQPRQMYWQFTDDANQLNNFFSYGSNADNLTSYVYVEYTMVVNRKDNGRKLICHYVTESWNDIQSEEVTLKVLYKPNGHPQVIPGEKKVKVNSAVSLTCDTEKIDGVITWYKWQFGNGTELTNTTEKTLTYATRGYAETLQFVCIAGNAAGQSSASAPIEVEIQRIGSDTKIPMILGIIIGLMTIVIIAMAVHIILIKLQMKKLKTQRNEPVYENNEVGSGKHNGDIRYIDPKDYPHLPDHSLPPDYVNLSAALPYEPLRK